MEHRIESGTGKGKGANRSKPMDIERFVEAPGRKELVAEVREKIDALGIEYLYLQFVSVTGRICGKGIPADHWESVADKGFQLVYGATMNLFVNRRGIALRALTLAATPPSEHRRTQRAAENNRPANR
jgi:hypothetical protein